jgi:hypothetical protein
MCWFSETENIGQNESIRVRDKSQETYRRVLKDRDFNDFERV